MTSHADVRNRKVRELLATRAPSSRTVHVAVCVLCSGSHRDGTHRCGVCRAEVAEDRIRFAPVCELGSNPIRCESEACLPFQPADDDDEMAARADAECDAAELRDEASRGPWPK